MACKEKARQVGGFGGTMRKKKDEKYKMRQGGGIGGNIRKTDKMRQGGSVGGKMKRKKTSTKK